MRLYAIRIRYYHRVSELEFRYCALHLRWITGISLELDTIMGMHIGRATYYVCCMPFLEDLQRNSSMAGPSFHIIYLSISILNRRIIIIHYYYICYHFYVRSGLRVVCFVYNILSRRFYVRLFYSAFFVCLCD